VAGGKGADCRFRFPGRKVAVALPKGKEYRDHGRRANHPGLFPREKKRAVSLIKGRQPTVRPPTRIPPKSGVSGKKKGGIGMGEKGFLWLPQSGFFPVTGGLKGVEGRGRGRLRLPRRFFLRKKGEPWGDEVPGFQGPFCSLRKGCLRSREGRHGSVCFVPSGRTTLRK